MSKLPVQTDLAHLHAGDRVRVVDALGDVLDRRAIGPMTAGHDFPVVWLCREEEWADAQAEGRSPDAVPWPAEDVKAL